MHDIFITSVCACVCGYTITYMAKLYVYIDNGISQYANNTTSSSVYAGKEYNLSI